MNDFKDLISIIELFRIVDPLCRRSQTRSPAGIIVLIYFPPEAGTLPNSVLITQLRRDGFVLMTLYDKSKGFRKILREDAISCYYLDAVGRR